VKKVFKQDKISHIGFVILKIF